ncbi:hypothetical protein CDG79_38090 [Nostoc sp. 'Peltigera membranacea cyanobiont' 232]|nr:hypothetical protein CDG79_38090 [Nostoc sp. 'Peltigera membranacea cyanobiont' 232]
MEQSMIRHSDYTSESWKNLPWKKFRQDLSRKAEGRRQKAEGNSDSCPLPVTVGNKGLRPPPN